MSVYMCNVSEGKVSDDHNATIIELSRTEIKEPNQLVICLRLLQLFLCVLFPFFQSDDVQSEFYERTLCLSFESSSCSVFGGLSDCQVQKISSLSCRMLYLE
jgi:hypothetical protein